MPAVADAMGTTAVDGTAIMVTHDAGGRLATVTRAVLDEVPALVVVDNRSRDGSLASLPRGPQVRLIRNDVNRGFSAAANQGARAAGGTWLVFVNPDVHLRPGDIARLVREAPRDVAALAALQVDARGRPRAETGGYDPSIGRYLVWALIPSRYHGSWGPWLAPPFPLHDTDLDWVSGALLAVRREVFEALGGFDERYFLYHEDVDFGRRVRAAGYRVVCRPSVRIHHEVAHGDPARRVLYTRRAVASLARDPRFMGWRRRALGLVLTLGFGLRAMLGSGTARARSRAALPSCREMVAGRLPPSR